MSSITPSIANAHYVVAYCERLNFGAEPVNTLSNLVFIAPALIGSYRLCLTKPAPPEKIHQKLNWALCLLPLAIALGSMLFHFQPSRLTQALDILPICLFAMVATWIILRNALFSQRYRCLVLLLWGAASALASSWPEFLAGTAFYVPTLLLLIGCSWKIPEHRRTLALLASLFAIALLARALDLPWCGAGSGTHAFWHAMAAVVCSGLIMLGINQGRAKSGRAPDHAKAHMKNRL